MRGDFRKRQGIVHKHSRVDINYGGVGVLHTSAAGGSRDMIDEKIGVERAVIHPSGFRGNNAADYASDLLQVVVCGIGVDQDAIVASRIVEISFVESSDFQGSIDQTIVVFR